MRTCMASTALSSRSSPLSRRRVGARVTRAQLNAEPKAHARAREELDSQQSISMTSCSADIAVPSLDKYTPPDSRISNEEEGDATFTVDTNHKKAFSLSELGLDVSHLPQSRSASGHPNTNSFPNLSTSHSSVSLHQDLSQSMFYGSASTISTSSTTRSGKRKASDEHASSLSRSTRRKSSTVFAKPGNFRETDEISVSFLPVTEENVSVKELFDKSSPNQGRKLAGLRRSLPVSTATSPKSHHRSHSAFAIPPSPGALYSAPLLDIDTFSIFDLASGTSQESPVSAPPRYDMNLSWSTTDGSVSESTDWYNPGLGILGLSADSGGKVTKPTCDQPSSLETSFNAPPKIAIPTIVGAQTGSSTVESLEDSVSKAEPEDERFALFASQVRRKAEALTLGGTEESPSTRQSESLRQDVQQQPTGKSPPDLSATLSQFPFPPATPTSLRLPSSATLALSGPDIPLDIPLVNFENQPLFSTSPAPLSTTNLTALSTSLSGGASSSSIPNLKTLTAPESLFSTPRKTSRNRDNPTRPPRGHHNKKIEGRIPRPPNAWILYRSDRLKQLKDVRAQLKEGQPVSDSDGKIAELLAKPQAELSKWIASVWREESSDVKDYYDQQADLAKIAHAEAHPDYRFQPIKKTAKDDCDDDGLSRSMSRDGRQRSLATPSRQKDLSKTLPAMSTAARRQYAFADEDSGSGVIPSSPTLAVRNFLLPPQAFSASPPSVQTSYAYQTSTNAADFNTNTQSSSRNSLTQAAKSLFPTSPVNYFAKQQKSILKPPSAPSTPFRRVANSVPPVQRTLSRQSGRATPAFSPSSRASALGRTPSGCKHSSPGYLQPTAASMARAVSHAPSALPSTATTATSVSSPASLHRNLMSYVTPAALSNLGNNTGSVTDQPMLTSLFASEPHGQGVPYQSVEDLLNGLGPDPSHQRVLEQDQQQNEIDTRAAIQAYNAHQLTWTPNIPAIPGTSGMARSHSSPCPGMQVSQQFHSSPSRAGHTSRIPVSSKTKKTSHIPQQQGITKTVLPVPLMPALHRAYSSPGSNSQAVSKHTWAPLTQPHLQDGYILNGRFYPFASASDVEAIPQYVVPAYTSAPITVRDANGQEYYIVEEATAKMPVLVSGSPYELVPSDETGQALQFSGVSQPSTQMALPDFPHDLPRLPPMPIPVGSTLLKQTSTDNLASLRPDLDPNDSGDLLTGMSEWSDALATAGSFNPMLRLSKHSSNESAKMGPKVSTINPAELELNSSMEKFLEHCGDFDKSGDSDLPGSDADTSLDRLQREIHQFLNEHDTQSPLNASG